jgi:uncharacterized protein (TIGR02452 family)
MKRSDISKETLKILRFGNYNYGGKPVDIGDALWVSRTGTTLYTPDDARFDLTAVGDTFTTSFSLEDETTIQGIRVLSAEGKERIGALNFASAKNPGGGFMGEAQAQEESLARCSSLYASLLECQEMYDFNRRARDDFYSDYMSYAPVVVFFRNDALELLEKPVFADIVTAPAVNRALTNRVKKITQEDIDACMRRRLRKVLHVFRQQACRHLVLGAWGCGVFRNDPTDVARYFSEFLCGDGEFAHAFESVRFSIPDAKGRAFQAFQLRFGEILRAKHTLEV